MARGQTKTAAGPPRRQALLEYCLRLGDSSLVLGHRLSEWCGHGPMLEEDIALANVALDQIGRARMLLDYAAELEGAGRSEDDLAFLRDNRDYRNLLLVEQPNGDYAATIIRQFLFDAWSLAFFERSSASADERLAAIAARAVKESRYHLRHSAAWVVRFGDGTEESHDRAQRALDELWSYTGELFETDEVDRILIEAGVGVDPAAIRPDWDRQVDAVLQEATLRRPEDGYMQSGGRRGVHSEHLGYLLAEMQFLQRAYPGAQW